MHGLHYMCGLRTCSGLRGLQEAGMGQILEYVVKFDVNMSVRDLWTSGVSGLHPDAH